MKRRSRTARAKPGYMELILAPPAADELVGLLRAWRFWILGGLIGALLGAAVYSSAPPPFRARATVNVDFHLEQAWPENTDREQFYYLERETRKLVEIAMSDPTLGAVANVAPDVTVAQLRDGKLQLSQPGSGGWHFYADDHNSETAALLANAWSRAFSDEVQREVIAGADGGLEPFITADVVQAESILPGRTYSAGMYILVGAGIALSLSAFGILLVRYRP
ncbi:MAG: hypothetical protein V1755_10560 [Chloroflexota bacterium]